MMTIRIRYSVQKKLDCLAFKIRRKSTQDDISANNIKRLIPFNLIPHGVIWITHIWGGGDIFYRPLAQYQLKKLVICNTRYSEQVETELCVACQAFILHMHV